MTKNYKYGRDKEQKVARALRGRGASVAVSPGSRSAVDLKVSFPTGTKWYVQVKSTRSARAVSVARREIGRLKQIATRSSATPVIATVTPSGIEYRSGRSGQRLAPPRTRK